MQSVSPQTVHDNKGEIRSRLRSILISAAWIAVAFIGAVWLLTRFDDLRHLVTDDIPLRPAPILTDKWMLVFASMMVLAPVGAILRWGFTIPFMLLGAFFVGPFLAQVNQSGAVDAARHLVCAGLGCAVGLTIDLMVHLNNWSFARMSVACVALAGAIFVLGRVIGHHMLAIGLGWEMAFHLSPLMFRAVEAALVLGSIVALIGMGVGPSLSKRFHAVIGGLVCMGSFLLLPWR